MNPLDTPVRLAELFEPGLLEDLCRDFVAQHRVGLRVFDDQVGALAEVRQDETVTRWVFTQPELRRRFVAFVDELKATRLEPDEQQVREDPATGCRYLLLPVTWDQRSLGKLVCGPYLRPDTSPAPDVAWLLGEVPRTSDEALITRARFLLKAIDLVCHAGYRALLTSSLHLAAITRAHEDLQRANTQLAESNARLAAQNEQLRELDTLKSDFLSTVSHELRTPLTSIIGYTEMILEGLVGPTTEEQRDSLRTILERSLNLLQLIEQVLAFSRADHGVRVGGAVAAVEVGRSATEAISAVRPQAQKGGLTLEVQLPPSLPTVMTDAAGLRQALINLLANAVKFTPPGGLVRLNAVVSARGGQPVLRFSVTDTGIGISPEQQAHIFEPFFQVDGSSTRAYGGTGLGLAIVKRFVESQGGVIDLESAVGVGTTISFDLPLKAAARPQPEAERRAVPPTRQQRPPIPPWAQRVVAAAEREGGRGGNHRS